jgi:hypothetical protein
MNPHPPPDSNGIDGTGRPALFGWPAIVLAVVAGMAAVIYAAVAERAEQREPPLPVPTSFEGQLIKLDREAIEAAYRQHVTSIFLTWMKDETGQPTRAVKGVNRARKAYVDSMRAIDQREGK